MNGALKTLAASPAWLKLLHYKSRWSGGLQSEVDRPEFFLSPAGRTDPEAELRATLAAFGDAAARAGRYSMHPLCVFPARKKLIESQIGSPWTTQVDCKDYLEWKAGIRPHSASIIYSSAYPNNPASMFGHTLLRFNGAKEAGSEGSGLLEYGANFEAVVGASDPGILYVFKGLLGFYEGQFNVVPYYSKVNEYNYSESRDLWEYDLNLPPDRVDLMADHLWELYSAGGFAYYFLDRNCSYQILALIEAVMPDWDLTGGFRTFVLPVDTLKKLRQVGDAVRAVRVRPSLKKQAQSLKASLADAQRSELRAVIHGETPIDATSSPLVADAAIAHYNYLKHKDAQEVKPAVKERLRKLLVKRATWGQGQSAADAVVATDSDPVDGHDSSAFNFGFFTRQGEVSGLIGARWSLHDLLNREVGYIPGSQIEVLHLDLAVDPDRNWIDLHRLVFADIVSMIPIDWDDLQHSWKLNAQLSRTYDWDASGPILMRAEVGLGGSYAGIYGYALLAGDAGSSLRNSYRLLPGVEIGYLAHYGRSRFGTLLSMKFFGEIHSPVDRVFFAQGSLGQSWSFTRNWELRGTARFDWRNLAGMANSTEGRLELIRFF